MEIINKLQTQNTKCIDYQKHTNQKINIFYQKFFQFDINNTHTVEI